MTPVSAAHRTPGNRRPLQWDVRSGGNRFAYISRYKSFSGLANRVSGNQWLREVCKFFLSQTRCALPSVRQAQKRPLRQAKIQKYSTRYIKTGNPGLYFNKHPKNLKHSAPQKKTCLPGEGKDREKDPHSHIGSCCLNGAWFYNCSG